MTKEDILRRLSKWLAEERSRKIPVEVVYRLLTVEYENAPIQEVLQCGIDDFVLDKVLDYPDKKWDIYDGRPIFHIKLLTDEESTALRNLKPIKLAIIWVLQSQEEEHCGEMAVPALQHALVEQGFTREECEHIWVADFVDTFFTNWDPDDNLWAGLIPEYKKTEEYKKAEEEMEREWMEKEARRMWFTEVMETLDQIFDILKKSPEWQSKEQVSKQLPDWCDYIDDAFESIHEEDELIETRSNPDGTKSYRPYPEEEW